MDEAPRPIRRVAGVTIRQLNTSEAAQRETITSWCSLAGLELLSVVEAGQQRLPTGIDAVVLFDGFGLVDANLVKAGVEVARAKHVMFRDFGMRAHKTSPSVIDEAATARIRKLSDEGLDREMAHRTNRLLGQARAVRRSSRRCGGSIDLNGGPSDTVERTWIRVPKPLDDNRTNAPSSGSGWCTTKPTGGFACRRIAKALPASSS